jgi:plasmid stabilization system protein ParE
MAKYKLSRLAAQDLDDITIYSQERYGVPQARRYAASVIQAFRTVSYFPVIGTNYQTKAGRNFRKFVVGRHAVFYKVDEIEELLIVRIFAPCDGFRPAS